MRRESSRETLPTGPLAGGRGRRSNPFSPRSQAGPGGAGRPPGLRVLPFDFGALVQALGGVPSTHPLNFMSNALKILIGDLLEAEL